MHKREWEFQDSLVKRERCICTILIYKMYFSVTANINIYVFYLAI